MSRRRNAPTAARRSGRKRSEFRAGGYFLLTFSPVFSMIDIETVLRTSLSRNVQAPYPSPEPGIKSSAVLVLLRQEGGAWELLFTQRGEQIADHPGQVAFPGGHVEPGDSGPLATALREASEEVGIPATAVDSLGFLDPVDTATGFRIWPVVCVLKQSLALRPAPPEVRDIFWIPLDWLRKPGRWEWRPARTETGHAEHPAVFFEAYQGRILWGASAMITLRLLDIIRGGHIR